MWALNLPRGPEEPTRAGHQLVSSVPGSASGTQNGHRQCSCYSSGALCSGKINTNVCVGGWHSLPPVPLFHMSFSSKSTLSSWVAGSATASSPLHETRAVCLRCGGWVMSPLCCHCKCSCTGTALLLQSQWDPSLALMGHMPGQH